MRKKTQSTQKMVINMCVHGLHNHITKVMLSEKEKQNVGPWRRFVHK